LITLWIIYKNIGVYDTWSRRIIIVGNVTTTYNKLTMTDEGGERKKERKKRVFLKAR
jgi:hypothetical protein